MSKKFSSNVIFQVNGFDFDASDIETRVKENMKARGFKMNAVLSLTIYVNPYEGKAYYVVDGEEVGYIDV